MTRRAKSAVHTHTFRRGKYRIGLIDAPLRGMCEVPDHTDQLYMYIPAGNTTSDLAVTIHEAMHAEGIPDRYLDQDGDDSAERIARLLVRLGWEKRA